MIRKVTLGQVAIEIKTSIKEQVSGMPIVGLEHLDPEELLLTRWDTSGKTTFTKTFHKDDVLFGRRRAYLKKAVIAPFDGICSGDITVIRAIPGKILPELLPFIIQNEGFFAHAIKNSDGSLSPRAKWSSLKEYSFRLDDDLEKQRELARVLLACHRSRIAYSGVLSQCDELIKSRFVEMFSLSKKGSLDQLVDQIRGVSYKPNDLGDNDVKHVPLLRANNISKGNIVLDDLQYVSRTKVTETQYLRGGDLLICASSGSIDVLGKHAYIASNLDITFGAFCKVLRPKNKLYGRYLGGFFGTDDYRRQIAEIGQGTNINNLNNGSIASIAVPIPNQEEAQDFINYQSQVNKLKFNLQQAIERAKRLSARILNDALSGNN